MKGSKSDGFNYDLKKAREKGNVFERVFHGSRVKFWLSVIDYKEKKVLEAGCNTGVILIPLLKMGVDAYGFDISRGDIKRAKNYLGKQGLARDRVRVADAKKMPYKANSFEIVILSDVLEHVSDPKAVANEAIRVVKKGGLVMVTVPNGRHPVVKYEWLRKLLSGRNSVDEFPDVPFNKRKLTNLFLKAKLVKTGYVGFGAEIFGMFEKV